MNDGIHASYRRLDRLLIRDITNQDFYTLREHARYRSINREGANLISCLVQRMDDTTEIGTATNFRLGKLVAVPISPGYNNLSASSLYRENFLSADISCAFWLSAVAMMILSCGSL